MTKRALLIGCNYPGTEAALRGCVNDVINVKDLLLQQKGFHPDDVVMMIDTDKRYPQPTGANIRKGLKKLAESAKPGDTIFMHYSGHGVEVPSETPDPDDDGQDQCICPTDMNLITDDDFRKFVNSLPDNVIFTLVSDSCHSGGLIEKAKEQIGPKTAPAGSAGTATGAARELPGYGAGYLKKVVEEEGGEGDEEDEGGYRRRHDYGGHDKHHGKRDKDRRGGHHHHGREESEESEEEEDDYGGHRKHHEHKHSEHHGKHDRKEGHRHKYEEEYYQEEVDEEEDGYGRRPKPSKYKPSGGHGTDGDGSRGLVKNRALPLGLFTSLLSAQMGGQQVGVGNIRTSLFQVFGEDSSPSVQVFVGILSQHGPKLMQQFQEGDTGGIMKTFAAMAISYATGHLSAGGAAVPHTVQQAAQSGSLQQAFAGDKKKADQPTDHNWLRKKDNAVLISGSQYDETSADVCPDPSDPTSAHGALTQTLLEVMKKQGSDLNYRELVMGVRAELAQRKFTQHPCLYAADHMLDRPFITRTVGTYQEE